MESSKRTIFTSGELWRLQFYIEHALSFHTILFDDDFLLELLCPLLKMLKIG